MYLHVIRIQLCFQVGMSIKLTKITFFFGTLVDYNVSQVKCFYNFMERDSNTLSLCNLLKYNLLIT
jgi:hypothetical protein